MLTCCLELRWSWNPSIVEPDNVRYLQMRPGFFITFTRLKDWGLTKQLSEKISLLENVAVITREDWLTEKERGPVAGTRREEKERTKGGREKRKEKKSNLVRIEPWNPAKKDFRRELWPLHTCLYQGRAEPFTWGARLARRPPRVWVGKVQLSIPLSHPATDS
jgi:hypothetical protein